VTPSDCVDDASLLVSSAKQKIEALRAKLQVAVTPRTCTRMCRLRPCRGLSQGTSCARRNYTAVRTSQDMKEGKESESPLLKRRQEEEEAERKRMEATRRQGRGPTPNMQRLIVKQKILEELEERSADAACPQPRLTSLRTHSHSAAPYCMARHCTVRRAHCFRFGSAMSAQ
jgi:hypothetical protein